MEGDPANAEVTMFPKIFSSTQAPQAEATAEKATGEASADAEARTGGGALAVPQDGDSAAGVEVADSDSGLPSAPTKMAQAADLFRKMSRKKGVSRKEVIEAFVRDIGLTPAGAATYYQTIKKAKR